ncbi:MAG: hypothetical protein WD848_12475 [Dehalococcoidia bacterium]
MAAPIEPTPVLTGKSAERFILRMKKQNLSEHKLAKLAAAKKTHEKIKLAK